jgi:hypothetical protein
MSYMNGISINFKKAFIYHKIRVMSVFGERKMDAIGEELIKCFYATPTFYSSN